MEPDAGLVQEIQSAGLERDDFSSNRHPAPAFCLSMISAQTLRVCREGKPVPTFPDHALRHAIANSARPGAMRCRSFAGGKKMPLSLSEPIAVATLFGRLLDLPERPHERNAQADDDAQKQQRQGRSCEHGEHPQIKANAVPTSGNKAASVQNTPRPRESCRRFKLYLTGPVLLPAVKGRQRDQLQTWTGRRRQP